MYIYISMCVCIYKYGYIRISSRVRYKNINMYNPYLYDAKI